MLNNYETNGVLNRVSNVPVCNVASNLDTEQQVPTTSAFASAVASTIDSNDQENEDCSNSNSFLLILLSLVNLCDQF